MKKNKQIRNIGPIKIPKRKTSTIYPVIDGSINKKLSNDTSDHHQDGGQQSGSKE